eukprot:CAMPEP_0175157560 /NCGR_PEP_ID=MMETSP0087-20121206/22280_1 /TAXON_ID=136419 /ORGANISM="Unknown Unknown, Strain D1" /LENGTH=639 /DNA_ID=CAMNT_0016445203 /DNA_START=15 /DNA_END=1931 /DNA_ORIENTATION=+
MITDARLQELLNQVPGSWNGTTYPNDKRFVGRAEFTKEMIALLTSKQPIEKAHLETLFPEDYLRVGSPLSNLLELVFAVNKGYEPANVFSFASSTMPLIAVLLAANSNVHVYGNAVVDKTQENLLRTFYGCNFEVHTGSPKAHGNEVVVWCSDVDRGDVPPCVDACVGTHGLLYIVNAGRVPPHDLKNAKGKIEKEGVHTIRKRFSAPPPTPDCKALLNGQPVQTGPDPKPVKDHLKQMAGCAGADGDPLLCTVGLSALAACVMGANELGNSQLDVLMCSTAYGGSSQQCDIMALKCDGLKKHTFDIQGRTGHVFRAISNKLSEMQKTKRAPVTLVQLEYPTNPDMKDCDLDDLEATIQDYSKAANSEVVLMFDTTFSPQSQAALKFKKIPAIVFNSLSKSVSGGFTTGGSLVANENAFAQKVLQSAHKHAKLFDSHSKGCQVAILAAQHGQCEERIAAAHKNCVTTAAHLEKTVLKYSGEAMKVNFVTAAQIAKKVTPATFSFNLPRPKGMSQAGVEALAQDFVDRLVEAAPLNIKPCVSFGQKNTLVYATVPATSTQGVISEEHKAKQAIGGVQLVRFSFPPDMDMATWNAAVETALKNIYTSSSSSTSSSSTSSSASSGADTHTIVAAAALGAVNW